MMKNITLLIPTYNEGDQLAKTIFFLLKNFPEIPIIIVDDGSSDSSIEKLPNSKNISICRNTKNLGKSASIAKGLRFVSTEWACLFDADLTKLQKAEIARGFEKTKTSKQEMIVFAQQNETLLWKKLDYHMLLSGERCVKTKVLKQFIKERQPTAYSFELELHNWFIQNQKPISTTPMHSKNKLKLSKWKPSTALKKSWEFYKYLLFDYKKAKFTSSNVSGRKLS